MRNILSAVLFSAATFVVGCTGSGEVQYSGGVTADVSTPDLVEVSPGVQVVADYDAPVFYNSGLYWRYNDGGWYSSSVYTGGWAYAEAPPSVIIGIDRPEHFTHYRPSGYVARHRPAPQREWHPAPVRREVRVEPHAEVRVEPRAEVRTEREVRVEPHAEVRTEREVKVEPHAEPVREVHAQPEHREVVVKPAAKPVVKAKVKVEH
jgi:hypothetical protein